MRRPALAVGLGLLLVVGFVLTLQSAQPVRAANLDVCPTCSYQTIQEAIDAAGGGDVIRVAQGVYTENITVDKEVTLEGGYESGGWTRNIAQYETIIDGSNSRTVWGDWDGGGLHSACVITDTSEYKMWYHSWGSNEIGLATSPDGVAWTKYPGNPVLSGSEGEWDEVGLIHVDVLKDGGLYKMWYCTVADSAIGYATSTNGVDWTKYADNPVLTADTGQWDEGGVANPSVIKAGGVYTMWYEGMDVDGRNRRIGCASSSSGTDWVKCSQNPVLDLGTAGEWDAWFTGDPDVVTDGNMHRIWYSGAATGWEDLRIGYATSTDGITWTKSPDNPVLGPGPEGSWDEGSVMVPNVLVESGSYQMWYTSNRQRGYATSDNGITWTKSLSNPVLTPGTATEWGQPVVKFVEGSDGSVLDGFTVRNGEAEYGGGVFINGVQVTAEDCVVTNNNARYGGGGIGVAWGADAAISSTQVLSNTVSEHFGGGIFIVEADADVRNCVVAHNRGAEWGGAGVVVDYYASATLVNNEIVSNTCPIGNDGGGGIRVNNHASAEIWRNLVAYNQADGGAGVSVTDNCTAVITNNQILSNTATYGGGGIGVWASRVTIGYNTINSNAARGAPGLDIGGSCADVYANIIAHNRVGDWGSGGMSISGGSDVTVTNNMVVSNAGTVMWWDGDGIAVWGDTTQARLLNNTIAFNSAEGVQTADACTVLVCNNIIVGNEGGIHDLDSAAAITIDHNDVWDNGWADCVNVTPGPGDISADPLFVNAVSGDYHLKVGSPCIDAGTNDGAPNTDFDGDSRPLDGDLDGVAITDMGADEFRPYRIYLPLVLKNVGG